MLHFWFFFCILPFWLLEKVGYLGDDYRGNYEKGSDELKSGDLSFEDEFVERGRDNRPEGSQYDPNGGRYEHQPIKVDVVVDCKTNKG